MTMADRFAIIGKTRLLLLAGALFASTCLAAPDAFAQQGYNGQGWNDGSAPAGREATGLQNRLNQLENQIQTLSRSVYRGAPPPEGSAVPAGDEGASRAALSMLEDRLAALEAKQRDQTGQIEKLMFDIKQAQDQMQKMQADIDLRFQQQGGGGATPAPEPRPGIIPPSPAPSNNGAGNFDTPAPASGTLGSLGSAGGAVSADALYESAFADVRDSKYDSAEVKLAEFMRKHASHPLAANAQYWLAETYYVRGDYRQSAKMFAKGYQDYPQGQKAADCLLKLGLSLSKLGKKEDACLSLQQLQKEFPGDASPVNRRAQQEIKQLGCG